MGKRWVIAPAASSGPCTAQSQPHMLLAQIKQLLDQPGDTHLEHGLWFHLDGKTGRIAMHKLLQHGQIVRQPAVAD